MSRRIARRNVEVNRTLIALLTVADIALLIVWLIFAFVIKRPFAVPGGTILIAFLLILVILIELH